MKTILIEDAVYKSNYKIEIVFSDKKTRIVGFSHFLKNHNHPQYNKYKTERNFKRFKIENGNIVWGKDWDMIFPIKDLYEGKINIDSGI